MRVRNRKMKAQNGLCFYCQQPMWLQDITGFCRSFELSREQALHLKCTAEHLIARTDGGPNSHDNIVAACHYCNQSRHKSEDVLTPEEFLKYVQSELTAGRWHRLKLLRQV